MLKGANLAKDMKAMEAFHGEIGSLAEELKASLSYLIYKQS